MLATLVLAISQKKKKMDTEKSDGDIERSVKEGTAFHEADLDRVQRRLSRNHVQM